MPKTIDDATFEATIRRPWYYPGAHEAPNDWPPAEGEAGDHRLGLQVIRLTLPYPLSANRYWRPVNLGKHISIVPTKEAKAFRADIGRIAVAAGVRKPITGRVAITVQLYPHRPLDWQARMRKFGAAWDDSVQCIDVDNANKVLLDALKGVAIEDDRWVRRIVSERMEPDADGARVVLTITPLAVEQPQAALLGEAA